MDNSHIRALCRLSSIRNVDEDRLVAYFPVLCPAIFQYHTTIYFHCKKEDVSIPAYHLASGAIPRNDNIPPHWMYTREVINACKFPKIQASGCLNYL